MGSSSIVYTVIHAQASKHLCPTFKYNEVSMA
jgi:hypothetical protein